MQDFESLPTSSVTPEINIINTIDEFIAEVVLDHKNAVPELKEHSKKDIQIHKHAVYKVNNMARPSVMAVAQTSFVKALSSFSNQYDYQFFEDIIPPPPKSA